MGNYKNYSNISNSIIGDNNQVNIQTNEISTETWNLFQKRRILKIEKYLNIFTHMLYKKIKLASFSILRSIVIRLKRIFL